MSSIFLLTVAPVKGSVRGWGGRGGRCRALFPLLYDSIRYWYFMFGRMSMGYEDEDLYIFACRYSMGTLDDCSRIWVQGVAAWR